MDQGNVFQTEWTVVSHNYKILWAVQSEKISSLQIQLFNLLQFFEETKSTLFLKINLFPLSNLKGSYKESFHQKDIWDKKETINQLSNNNSSSPTHIIEGYIPYKMALRYPTLEVR